MLTPGPVQRELLRLQPYALKNLIANIEQGQIERWSIVNGVEASILTYPGTNMEVRLQLGSRASLKERFGAISRWLDSGSADWVDRVQALKLDAMEILNGREAEIEALVAEGNDRSGAHGSPL